MTGEYNDKKKKRGLIIGESNLKRQLRLPTVSKDGEESQKAPRNEIPDHGPARQPPQRQGFIKATRYEFF